MNICFEGQRDVDGVKGGIPIKEVICFETSKVPVWAQLEVMALAPA
jgi:hypothetical protein